MGYTFRRRRNCDSGRSSHKPLHVRYTQAGGLDSRADSSSSRSLLFDREVHVQGSSFTFRQPLNCTSTRVLRILCGIVPQLAVAAVSFCGEFGSDVVCGVVQCPDSFSLIWLRRSPHAVGAVGRYPKNSGTWWEC